MNIINKFFSALFKQKTNTYNLKTAASTALVVQKAFCDVSLSKLDELAKSIYNGISATIDEYGFLLFKYTSNSGKTTYRSQMKVNEFGKLVDLCGRHYPGQWWSAAVEFIKRANELSTFTNVK